MTGREMAREPEELDGARGGVERRQFRTVTDLRYEMTRLYWEARKKVKNPGVEGGITTGQANQLAQILQFSAKLMTESEPMEELRELKKEHKAALEKLAQLEAAVQSARTDTVAGYAGVPFAELTPRERALVAIAVQTN